MSDDDDAPLMETGEEPPAKTKKKKKRAPVVEKEEVEVEDPEFEVEYTENGHFKKFTSWPFIVITIIVAVDTVIFVFNAMAAAKINFISVSDWRWVALTELALGLGGVLASLVISNIMPKTVGSTELKPYRKSHWFAYTFCSMTASAIGAIHFAFVFIQFSAYGNRLTLSDFTPSDCTITTSGVDGCQYDAAQAASRWFSVKYMQTQMWIVLAITYVMVIRREQNPSFTKAYIERAERTSKEQKRVTVVRHRKIASDNDD